MKLQLLLLTLAVAATDAFVVLPHQAASTHGRAVRFSTTTPLFALPKIDSMRITEIRQELESYGLSTKSFLEKREMVKALEKARKEGKKPVEEEKPDATSEANNSKMSREDKIKAEMEKATKMKVGDLKKDLEGRGISTKSFFEKPEFVKAYAEAVVDGVKGKSTTNSSRRAADPPPQEEEYDSTYRDVVMQKFDPRDARLMLSKVIDVKLPAATKKKK
mmetsp:Transcript_30453/g.50268  ORF Transcript_30453/g.50268 Transcript_30453/m.50268 type:complete len:219 (-) Transcript_30453:73-729(-)|eukprot:CAMPEP_0119015724 /NCGR_PEP_ID=MMETSP1176-20130426/11489_1 /TAXON_ID=265551 /ORGANISM="Synedropsis recta cf, Strain CCMP1620" /LENGTH=218 /DNA_ID=CAMNT_0006969037 /DNA_START=105 /DNA_END=761 /DNA_ORIENTATION=+